MDFKEFQAQHKKHVKGILSDKIGANSNFIIRIIASLSIIAFMLSNLGASINPGVLKKDECMRDQTFIDTDKYNRWLGDPKNTDINKLTMILASF